MINQIINIALKTLKCLKDWKIVVGKNPGHVFPNPLIIFPLIPDRLFCGLTGILTIKKVSYDEEKDITENLSCLFGENQKK